MRSRGRSRPFNRQGSPEPSLVVVTLQCVVTRDRGQRTLSQSVYGCLTPVVVADLRPRDLERRTVPTSVCPPSLAQWPHPDLARERALLRKHYVTVSFDTHSLVCRHRNTLILLGRQSKRLKIAKVFQGLSESKRAVVQRASFTKAEE